MAETYGFNPSWMHGLGGLPREPTSLEGTLAAIPGVGSYIAYGRYLDAEAQKKRALQDETAFRAERAALGPGATPEDMFRVGARYAGPSDLMGKSDEWAKIIEAKKSREAMQAGLERIYGGGAAPAQAQAEPQPLGMGFPAGGAPEVAPQAAPDPEARIAQLTATRLLYAGNQAYQSAIDREIDKLRAVKSDQPSVHVVQDKTSPTGWSYSDVKTDKILSKGAPPPASADVGEKLTPEGWAVAKELASAGKPIPGGWSKNGISRGNALLNQMGADQEGGAGSGSIVAKQADYKANSQALSSVTKDLSTISPFNEMLHANAKIAIDLAEKIASSRTGSQLANKPITWLQKNAADNPDIAEYLFQMHILSAEGARVINNPRLVGQMSYEANRDMQAVVNGNMPLGQTKAVLARMTNDGDRRVGKMREQRDALVKAVGGKSEPAAVNPSPVPAQGGWRVTPVP